MASALTLAEWYQYLTAPADYGDATKTVRAQTLLTAEQLEDYSVWASQDDTPDGVIFRAIAVGAVLPTRATSDRTVGGTQQEALAAELEAAQPSAERGATLVDERSYSFKAAEGRASPGYEWHHIVEQNPNNLARFGPEALHSTTNVVQVEYSIHRRISGLYSSRQFYSNQMRVRQRLAQQSFDDQFQFGLAQLREIGGIE